VEPPEEDHHPGRQSPLPKPSEPQRVGR
jgi:hypothetical protein